MSKGFKSSERDLLKKSMTKSDLRKLDGRNRVQSYFNTGERMHKSITNYDRNREKEMLRNTLNEYEEDSTMSERILDFNNGWTDACLFRHGSDNERYYEVGIELPMDFVSFRNIDPNKLCELVGITGFPITVMRCDSPMYGALEGKPVLFVSTRENIESEAIKWAHDAVEKVAGYDFADYYITHRGFGDLEKDEQPEFMTPETFNMDTGKYEDVDEGIEDDIPFGNEPENEL